MKAEKLLADALLKGLEKGKTIKVTIQAANAADGPLHIAARIAGTQ